MVGAMRSLVLVACALLGVGACKDKGGTAAGGKPRVAVSIFPLHDVATRVAGDRLDVVLVLPPGRSEHGYEPTPKEVSKVAGSKLVILAGFAMDEWAHKLVSTASPDVKELELGPLCDPRPFTLEHVGEEAAEEAGGDHHEEADEHHHEEGGMDPHFWLDPVRMQKAVDAMVAAFSGIDPEGAAGYKERGEATKKALAALNDELQTHAKGWKKRTIVTFHASMGYFAERYDLKLAAVIEPFPGREPTAKYMGEVLAAIKETGAAALFSEPQLDRAPAKTIADQAGLPLFELDPVGGTAGAESYEKLLQHDVEVLDKALSQ